MFSLKVVFFFFLFWCLSWGRNYHLFNHFAREKLRRETALSQKVTEHSCAVITAIFGLAEREGKPMAPQERACDFYLFTNNLSLPHDPIWKLVTTPYHLQLGKATPEEIPSEHGEKRRVPINPISSSSDSFLIAKFYKIQFHKIDILKPYRTVFWVDGTIELIHPTATQVLGESTENYGITLFGHHRESLFEEVVVSNFEKYDGQHVLDQYARYLHQGYCEGWWRAEDRQFPCKEYVDVGDVTQYNFISSPLSEPLIHLAQRIKSPSPDKRPTRTFDRQLAQRPHFGVWVTCLVGFDTHNPRVKEFLDLWWDEIVYGSTQDQVSFSYAVWRTALIPFTLPSEFRGDFDRSELHIKHAHNVGIMANLHDLWEDMRWRYGQGMSTAVASSLFFSSFLVITLFFWWSGIPLFRKFRSK